MQITLDGFNSTGPNDEQKWVTWDLEGIKQYVIDLLDSSDTIIIGRKLAVDYIPYWEETVKNSNDPMYEFATRIVNARKVVFTKTIERSIWNKTELSKGDLADEINELKKQNGKDIIVYGGDSFVSSLIQHDLIDEYYVLANPAALGNGQQTFNPLKNELELKLVGCKPFACGAVLVYYTRRQ